MKRLQLKKLFLGALIASTVASIGAIPVKATSLSELYKEAYKTTMDVVETGKKYNITPRHANNNTNLNSNNLDDLYKAVEEGNIQRAINHARECISKLPSNQWQAKNTFSNLLDGYQQPSYENIVYVVLQLNKLIKEDENKFLNPMSFNDNEKKEFCNTIKERQHYIEIARALNNGVDPAYGKTYSSSLDEPQQAIINMINIIIEDANKSSNLNDIEFADDVVKSFNESVNENSTIKNYAVKLQKNMDYVLTLAKEKDKIEKAKIEAEKKVQAEKAKIAAEKKAAEEAKKKQLEEERKAQEEAIKTAQEEKLKAEAEEQAKEKVESNAKHMKNITIKKVCSLDKCDIFISDGVNFVKRTTANPEVCFSTEISSTTVDADTSLDTIADSMVNEIEQKLEENKKSESDSVTVRRLCSGDTCTIIRCEGNKCTKTITDNPDGGFSQTITSESIDGTSTHSSSSSISFR